VAVIRDRSTVREDLPSTDALVTDLVDFAIGVRTADCIPVLLHDPVHHAVAAIHAGWKGTRLGIPAVAIRTMASEYGTSPSDLIAQIGPGIGPSSFQVGEDVVEAFKQEGFPVEELAFFDGDPAPKRELEPGTRVEETDSPMRGGWHFDLWKANEFILKESGVLPQNIRISGICTYLRNDLFHSARRETIKCPRIINVVRLLP